MFEHSGPIPLDSTLVGQGLSVESLDKFTPEVLKNPLKGADLSLAAGDSLTALKVNEGLSVAKGLLTQFAVSSGFTDQLEIAFGNEYDRDIAQAVGLQWAKDNFGDLPQIQVLSSEEMRGANGAFAISTNTIYLSKEFVDHSGLNSVVSVIVEEIGHSVDARINRVDAAGDEGDIFSRVVQNQPLNNAQLAALKVEDDHGLISIGGVQVAIERNDSLRTAENLGTLNTSAYYRRGWVGANVPNDFYRFYLNNTSNFSVSLTGLGADVDVFLLNSNGNRVAKSDNSNTSSEYFNVSSLGAGQYYLQVNRWSGDSRNSYYDLSLNATPVGNYVGFYEHDRYLGNSMNLGEGNYNYVGNSWNDRISAMSIPQGWTVEAFEHDNYQGASTVFSGTNSYVGNTWNDRISSLKVYRNPADSAGNSTGAARDIGTLNTSRSFSDWVGTIDTQDYYRFNLSDQSNFSLGLAGLSSDADIQLLNASGTVINSSGASGSNSESINTQLGTGTYYVRVYQYNGNTNYNLSLNATLVLPPDYAGNSTGAARDIGTVNGSRNYSDWVGNGDVNDYYRFSVGTQSNFSLSLTGLSSNADVQLLNASGTVINSSGAGGNNAEYINAQVGAGTYYVRVYQYSGNTNYNLSLNATPMGDFVGFYEHDRYLGNSMTLGEGNYNYVGNSWNDRISAMFIPQGWTVEAFEHDNYQGASTVFSGANSYVGNAWNDRISSVKIYQNRHGIVANFYRDILGREPDQNGLNSYVWSNFTLTQIRSSIANSDEARKIQQVGEWRGEYFNNRNLSGYSTFARIDSNVNNDWGLGSPGGGVGNDNFSVRWTGKFDFGSGSNYLFRTLSDDGIRLWIDGNLAIDQWNDHGPTEYNANRYLSGVHQVKVEYYENGGGATAKVWWNSISSVPLSGTINAKRNSIEGDKSFAVSLLKYDANGQASYEINPNKDTILVIHGWNNNGTSLDRIAKAAASNTTLYPNTQVLSLDWGQAASAVDPFTAAGAISDVAKWAAQKLKDLGINPDRLHLFGHSLGAYVASQIGRELGKVGEIIALDPAMPLLAFNDTGKYVDFDLSYDLNGAKAGILSPADFSSVAKKSIAFVVSDQRQEGVSGDNRKATTANTSFIINLSGDPENDQLPLKPLTNNPLEINSIIAENKIIIAENVNRLARRNRMYHQAVVDVFVKGVQKGLSFPSYTYDWYGDLGNKLDKSQSSQHEGVISATKQNNGWGITAFNYVDSSGQIQNYSGWADSTLVGYVPSPMTRGIYINPLSPMVFLS